MGRFAAVAALAITLAVSAGFLAIANGFPFGEGSTSNSFFDQLTPAGPADLILPDSGTPGDQSTSTVATETGCPQGQEAGADGVCATAVAEAGEQDEHQGEHEDHEGGDGEHESGHEAED